MARRAAAAYLYPMVCSYIMILFASFVVRGYLVIRLTRLRVCEGGGLDDDDNMYDDEANKCDEDEVSRQSSSFLSWSALSYSLPAILASGPLGRLANRKGRRAPAVCVITGELILSLNTWAVASYECRPEWMLIGFVVEGMMGSYSNLLMVTSAYVADLNYRDKELVSDTFKAERFAFVEASLAIGIILGPFLGGHSLAFMSYDTFYMYVSVGCATLIAYVLMIVPESLNKSECEDSASQSYGFGDTVAALRLVFATRPHNKLKLLKPLVESRRESDLSAASSSGDIRCPLVPEVALVPALKLHKVSLAFMVLFGTYNAVNQLFFLYSNRVWGWDSATYGTFSAISGSVGALNLILFRRLVAYGFGRALEDVPFICFGAAAAIFFNGAFALFNSPTAVYCLLPIASFQLSVVPSYRHLFSNVYGPAEQAQVFAAFSVLESIPGIFAPLLFNSIYAATVGFAPPLVYVAAMTSSILGLGLLCTASTTISSESTKTIIGSSKSDDEDNRNGNTGVINTATVNDLFEKSSES